MAASVDRVEDRGEAWYCLRTRPKQEKRTAQILRTEVGIEVFCPFIRFKRAKRTGPSWITEAMFPCYLFARFDFAETARHVRASAGVSSIVSFGKGPVVVSEEIVSRLRSEVDDGEVIEIPSQIQEGIEVNVVSGPFSGVRVLVTRVIPARERVAVLLEMLGTTREVEIPVSDVLPDVIHPMAQ